MSDHFFKKNIEEEWTNLYKNVVQNYHSFPKNIQNNGLHIALQHLLPLAKELLADESLHCLMPWQHHGVISLFLMDWEKQTTRAFLMIHPSKDTENVYEIFLQDENLPYSARPIKTIEAVPLGAVCSLIHTELQARTAQRSTTEPK